MKRSALITTSILAIATFAAASPAFASVNVSVTGNSSESNVSVHQEGTSQSTTCINGKCTTTGGGGNSTVCINGECTEHDGDVDMQSDNGNTRINISNSVSTGDNSVTTNDTPTATPQPTISEPTITVDPAIEQKMDDLEKEVDETTERIKTRAKSDESSLMQFIKEEIDSLNNFINNLFS